MKAMFEKERFSPLLQLSILLMVFALCYILGVFIVGLISALYLHVPFSKLAENAKLLNTNVAVLRMAQVVGSFFILALPALILAFIVNRKKPHNYLGFNIVISGKQMFFTVLIFMCALWVSEILGIVNELIPIPKNSEVYFRKLEDDYTKEATILLTMKDGHDYILSLIVVALLPAVFEELLFRGCLQKIMVSVTRNAFAGILITSIIFSLFHQSYYGFLPRVFLGITLGYLYYYSKNIWLNITAHFLNNAFTITIMYSLVRQGKTLQDALKDSDVTPKMALYNTLFTGLLCCAALYFLFKAYRRESERVLAVNNMGDSEIDNNQNNPL